jgi:signal transduction histidine kinase
MPVRTSAGIAVVLLALSAIVGLSMSSATVEQERLLAEFTAETGQQVHSSAEALSRLDSVHQDMRMLADLVERSRQERQLDPPTERRVWESAFRALAVVVVHYRIIALVSGDGALDVLAIDPTENRPTADAVLADVVTLGKLTAAQGAEKVGRSARLGPRSFLIYATPVKGGGAIVVASDAALLLRSVAWPQLPASRLFVTDPSGVVWSGCETSAGCRIADREVVPSSVRSTTRSPVSLDVDQAERSGLFRAPAISVSEKVSRTTGNWVVTWIASTQAMLRREQSLLARIATTGVAAAIVVAVVGMIVLRQQRRATLLADQLRYARARAKAQDLENQLIRADRLITVGVMATEIAHEVGTPLAVVRGRAEHIGRGLDDGAVTEDLAVIIRQVDQISSTIRQLLDFSRRSPLDKRAVALGLIVERTQQLLQLKLEARHLQLEIALSEDLPMLTADPDQLQQVLVNLLLNACDASPAGGRVTLSARPAPNDMVLIEIVDHGTGIAPADLESVFDPFFTTKPRGEGTGLGLSITAGIVRNHAGRIDLRSAPDEGTTVTVLWPASPPPGDKDV